MRVREAEQAGCQWDHKEAQAAQLDVLYGDIDMKENLRNLQTPIYIHE
jgi:hypothetical protein